MSKGERAELLASIGRKPYGKRDKPEEVLPEAEALSDETINAVARWLECDPAILRETNDAFEHAVAATCAYLPGLSPAQARGVMFDHDAIAREEPDSERLRYLQKMWAKISKTRAQQERDDAIVAAVRAGADLSQVARQFGVSPTLVERAAGDAGVILLSSGRRSVYRNRVFAMLDQDPTLKDRAIAKTLGCSVPLVWKFRRQWKTLRGQKAPEPAPELEPEAPRLTDAQQRALDALIAEPASIADGGDVL